MAKFCTNCGKEISEGNVVCTECGTPVDGAPAVQTQPTANKNNSKGNGMAIAGFIISLVSLILCCGSLSWLSLIFSIIGMVSAKKLMGNGKGLAIAGIIISAIGMIIFFLFVFLLPILGISTLDVIEDEVNDEWKNIQNYDNDDYNYEYDFDN